jgi:hypothetical protein
MKRLPHQICSNHSRIKSSSGTDGNFNLPKSFEYSRIMFSSDEGWPRFHGDLRMEESGRKHGSFAKVLKIYVRLNRPTSARNKESRGTRTVGFVRQQARVLLDTGAHPDTVLQNAHDLIKHRFV